MVEKAYNGFPAQYRNAQSRVQTQAFKDGTAYRPSRCAACGLNTLDRATIHAHNEDYHEPLNFIGLCFICHMAVHHRFRNLTTWHLYRDAIARGWQPPATNGYSVFATLWDHLHATLQLTSPPDPIPDQRNILYTLPDEEPDLYTPHPHLF